MADMQLFGRSISRRIMVLGIIGIILVIAGLAILTIYSSLLGSGLGIALLIHGFLLLIIGVWRFATKR